MVDKLDIRWIHSFANRFQVLSRKQPGKPLLSPIQILERELETTCNMGHLKHGFEKGDFVEENMNNSD